MDLKQSTIQFHIDELSIKGDQGLSATLIRKAVERELARRFQLENRAAINAGKGNASPRIQLDELHLKLASHTHEQNIAAQIAQNVQTSFQSKQTAENEKNHP